MKNKKFQIREQVKGTWALDAYDWVYYMTFFLKVHTFTMFTNPTQIILIDEKGVKFAVLPSKLKHVTLID